MNTNPYRSPQTEAPAQRPDDLPGYLRYREFRPRGFLKLAFTVEGVMKKLREEAEAFVNSHVGVDNVVSITEHVAFRQTLTVGTGLEVSSRSVS